MESNIFIGIKEFRKEYKELRSEIIKNFGLSGTSVRLQSNAIQLLQKFDDTWIPVCSGRGNMEDWVRMREGEKFKMQAHENLILK